MGTKLTKAEIDGLKPGAGTIYFWDAELKGFGVRVSPRGRKVYVYQYRVGTRTTRLTIGACNKLTVKEAREKVLKVDRRADNKAHNATLNELFEAYQEVKVAKGWKPKSATIFDSLWRNHIARQIGHMKASTVAGHHIQDCVVKPLRGKTPTLYGALSLLHAVFEFGVLQERIPDMRNPVSRVIDRPTKPKPRDRAMTVEQMRAVFQAIAELEGEQGGLSPQSAGVIRLLALTGARLREIMHAEWVWVKIDADARRAVIELPDSKTGEKPVYVTGPAFDVLASMERVAGSRYVFPGQKPGSPLTDIAKAWRRVLLRAGLPAGRSGFTLHDLRHSYATLGAAAGVPLSSLAKALGHSAVAMTARYINPSADQASAATETVGARIVSGLDGGNVVPLRRAG